MLARTPSCGRGGLLLWLGLGLGVSTGWKASREPLGRLAIGLVLLGVRLTSPLLLLRVQRGVPGKCVVLVGRVGLLRGVLRIGGVGCARGRVQGLPRVRKWRSVGRRCRPRPRCVGLLLRGA